MYTRSVGYQECIACGGDAFVHPLCEWCKLGALEYNQDPDSVFNEDFDSGLLGYWERAGELIAEREQAEADARRKGW